MNKNINKNINKNNINYKGSTELSIQICLNSTCQDISTECLYTYYSGYPANETDPAQASSVELHYVWIRYDGMNRVNIKGMLDVALIAAIEDNLCEHEFENRS